ncbi:MAG: phBC6A51 family helix-turn-helix protein [Candidatus Falkowbacteria bacterium]
MKTKFEQSRFIKILEEAPFISYAAKKAGIARATIYRWKKNNPEFREQLERALDSGRDHLIDIAEIALVEKIKSKDMTAIKFFLQHNDTRYRPMRAVSAPPESNKKLSDEETFIYDSLSQLSDEALDRQIKEVEQEIIEEKKENNRE